MRKSWFQMAALAGTVAAVVAAAGGSASAQQSAGQQDAVSQASGRGLSSGTGQPVLRQVATVTYPAPEKAPASFDISWVDPATQTYYLADRTNNGVDAINAASDTFESVLGSGDFTGSGTTATAAQQATCGPTGTGGPNGVLSLDVGGVRQFWAGNGVDASAPVSTVKVFDLAAPGSGTLAATIPTGGKCRADELSYDPVDHLVLIANDLDKPAFVSLISVNRDPTEDKVVKTITFPDAIDGIEQSAYDPGTGMFYVNIPQVPTTSGAWQGEVAVINPRTMSLVRIFPVAGCSPAGLAIDTASEQMLLGCSGDAMTGDTVGGVTYGPNHAASVIMNDRDGRIVGTTGQVGGSDEVWFDPASRTYYLAARNMTSTGDSTGYPAPVLGVIAAGPASSHGAASRWLGNFPTVAQTHSVAVNSANGQVFAPIPGYGIAVFTASRR
jgi:hypothetical protein